jgi:hypothetical protein
MRPIPAPFGGEAPALWWGRGWPHAGRPAGKRHPRRVTKAMALVNPPQTATNRRTLRSVGTLLLPPASRHSSDGPAHPRPSPLSPVSSASQQDSPCPPAGGWPGPSVAGRKALPTRDDQENRPDQTHTGCPWRAPCDTRPVNSPSGPDIGPAICPRPSPTRIPALAIMGAALAVIPRTLHCASGVLTHPACGTGARR